MTHFWPVALIAGLLTAAIKDCPVFGGKVKAFNAAAVQNRPGVKRVVLVTLRQSRPRYRAMNRQIRAVARRHPDVVAAHFAFVLFRVGATAAVFHSAPSMSSIDTKVGSPPMVRRTSPACRRRSTSCPAVQISVHCASE